MKRQLSLVLALVMILGSFSAVFAAEMPTTAVDKAAFLKSEGILKGNNDGELKLDVNLKRRDALVVLSRLFDKEDVAKAYPAGNLTFTDLTDPHYNGYVAWAVEEGYAKGKVEGVTFGLNDPLTAQQFSTTLLRALGYEENGTDIFKDSYKTATDLGILEDVKAEEKDTVTRADMAAMTFNALGVVVKGGDKTLAETLGIEMPEAPAAKELTAKVNTTENLKEVVVELSNAKLADEDKLQDAQNYKVAGFVVESAKLDGDNVIVLLEEALVKGRTYDLTIRNIDKAVNAKYSFKAEDNTAPEVEEVTVLGEYGIKVTTSEPIKNAKERNFLIDGKNVSMEIEQYGNDVILTPYYNASFPANAKTLTIKELEDFAGYKSVSQDFDIKIDKDDVAPKVVDMVSRGNVVEVTFDKDIYNNSVGAYGGRTDVGNISYQEGRQTIYATDAEKIDTNKVKYTFDKEIPRRTALTLADVSNHSKVKMDNITQEPRLVLDYSEPEIISRTTKITSATTATITLKFDKAVEGNFKNEADLTEGFETKNHFTLFERDVYRGQEAKDITMTAKYADNAKVGDVVKEENLIKDTIVIKLSRLTEYELKDNDLNYVLEVENFTDATSLRNKMYRDYVDFKVIVGTDFRVVGVEVDQNSSNTEISIVLSKPVDKAIAEQFTNYQFKVKDSNTIRDIKDLKGEVYAELNGKVVTIILPADTFRKVNFDTLTILNTLKDVNGNRLDKTVVYDFATETLLVPGQTVDQAKAKLVEDKINALTAVDKIDADNLAEVDKAAKAARTAYNEDLTAVQRALVTNVSKLVEVEDKVESLKNAAQTLDEAVIAVKAALAKFVATNDDTIKEDIETAVEEVVVNGATVTVEFTRTLATDIKAGKIEGTVELKITTKDGTTTIKTVAINKEIPKLIQTLSEAKGEVEVMLLTVTNATTEAEVLAAAEAVVINDKINVSIANFAKTDAEVEKAGSVTADIVLTLEGEVKVAKVSFEIAAQ